MSINHEIIGYVCDKCGKEDLHETNPGTEPDIPRGWIEVRKSGNPYASAQHFCPECIPARDRG